MAPCETTFMMLTKCSEPATASRSWPHKSECGTLGRKGRHCSTLLTPLTMPWQSHHKRTCWRRLTAHLMACMAAVSSALYGDWLRPTTWPPISNWLSRRPFSPVAIVTAHAANRSFGSLGKAVVPSMKRSSDRSGLQVGGSAGDILQSPSSRNNNPDNTSHSDSTRGHPWSSKQAGKAGKAASWGGVKCDRHDAKCGQIQALWWKPSLAGHHGHVAETPSWKHALPFWVKRVPSKWHRRKTWSAAPNCDRDLCNSPKSTRSRPAKVGRWANSTASTEPQASFMRNNNSSHATVMRLNEPRRSCTRPWPPTAQPNRCNLDRRMAVGPFFGSESQEPENKPSKDSTWSGFPISRTSRTVCKMDHASGSRAKPEHAKWRYGFAPLRSAFKARTAPALSGLNWESPKCTTEIPCSALGHAIILMAINFAR